MNKIRLSVVVVILGIFFVGCTEKQEPLEITAPESAQETESIEATPLEPENVPERIDFTPLDSPVDKFSFYFIPEVKQIEEFINGDLIDNYVVKETEDNTVILENTEDNEKFVVVRNNKMHKFEYFVDGSLRIEYSISYTDNGTPNEIVYVYYSPQTSVQNAFTYTKKTNFIYNNNRLEIRKNLTDNVTGTYRYDDQGRITSVTYSAPVLSGEVVDQYEYLNDYDFNVEPFTGMVFKNPHLNSYDRKEHRVRMSGNETVVTDRIFDDGQIIHEETQVWADSRLIEYQNIGSLLHNDDRRVFHY